MVPHIRTHAVQFHPRDKKQPNRDPQIAARHGPSSGECALSNAPKDAATSSLPAPWQSWFEVLRQVLGCN
jgi:hypothetical protein